MSAIPVVFTINRAFLPYMAVTMQSILSHTGARLEFIVLHKELTADDEAKLRDMLRSAPNASLRMVDLGERLKNYDFYTENRPSISKETYFRLIIPFLFPEYDKVLYLDSDMVFREDVSELFGTDLGGKLAGAVRDYTGYPGDDRQNYRVTELGLTDLMDYFISATLLINTKRFREEYTEKEILALATSRHWYMHDQDVMNFLCRNGNVLFLDPKWNVLDENGYTRTLPEPHRSLYLESLANPAVMHYGGNRKPWLDIKARWAREFWQVAVETPFFEEITDEMQKNFPLNLTYARSWTPRGCRICIRCFFFLLGDWWRRRVSSRFHKPLRRRES